MKMNRRGAVAISEIIILVVAIFAFAYLVGQEFESVEAWQWPSWLPFGTSSTAAAGTGAEAVAGYQAFSAGATVAGAPAGAVGTIPAAGGGFTFVNAAGTPLGAVSASQASGLGLTGTGTASGGGLLQGIYGLNPNAVGAHAFVDGIISAAAWGLTAYLIVRIGGNLLGLDEGAVNAASIAAGIGTTAGRLVAIGAEKGFLGLGKLAGWLNLSPAAAGLGVGIVVTVALYLILWEDVRYEIVTFECHPWDAPTGGGEGDRNDCEKCNKNSILPCSEYQCKSLGQGCEIINPGTEEERCEWINRHDTDFPKIRPWLEVLTPDHKYEPYTDDAVSPPERGVEIIYENSKANDGCIQAFTPLAFGIELDEPGMCKLDYVRKRNFDDMNFFFGGSSLFRYNHTQILSLPGPNSTAAENPTLQNDGVYELFARCQDANGNYNTANFLIKFCVEKGPDETPPLIVTTNLLNGMPVAHNVTEIDIELYVNEPADCRWSRTDQDYDDMEHEMQCSRSVFEMNAQLLYKCSGNLDGIKAQQENDYYFRCKDQPLAADENDRIENRQSYEFTLVGTQPLYISHTEPNGTIKDSTSPIEVTLEATTREGYDEGRANCYFSDTGEEGSFILFDATDSHEHSQSLFLPEGNYEYAIKCVDLGGNTDTRTVDFEVDSDTAAPMVVRVYKFDNKLRIITNEEADQCVYGIDSCEFSFIDGSVMQKEDDEIFVTDWSTDFTYYIKCKDEFENQPLPNQCSMIVRPFEFYEFELAAEEED